MTYRSTIYWRAREMTSLSSRCEINNLNKIAQLLSYSNVCVSIWLVSIYTLKDRKDFIRYYFERKWEETLLYWPSFSKVFLMRLRKSLDNNNNPVTSSLVHVVCCYCSSFSSEILRAFPFPDVWTIIIVVVVTVTANPIGLNRYRLMVLRHDIHI